MESAGLKGSMEELGFSFLFLFLSQGMLNPSFPVRDPTHTSSLEGKLGVLTTGLIAREFPDSRLLTSTSPPSPDVFWAQLHNLRRKRRREKRYKMQVMGQALNSGAVLET